MFAKEKRIISVGTLEDLFKRSDVSPRSNVAVEKKRVETQEKVEESPPVIEFDHKEIPIKMEEVKTTKEIVVETLEDISSKKNKKEESWVKPRGDQIIWL